MGREKEWSMRIQFNRRTGSYRTIFCTGYSLRSTLDMRPSLAVKPSFPLTLTLSLGEREQLLRNAFFAHTGLANSVAAMAERRGTILPLPWGEFLFSAPAGLA